MINFIIAFATYDSTKHINHAEWIDTNDDRIILSTIQAIRNINKVHSNIDKKIILVDNTNSFPDIELPNLEIIKGWQYLPEDEVIELAKMHDIVIDNIKTQSMWASLAYNVGIAHAKKDSRCSHIILQHNDIAYHTGISLYDMIEEMEEQEYHYISADFKKITLSAYATHKKLFDGLVINKSYNDNNGISPLDGGYLKTKTLGLADCYFFLASKEFFDDYNVDWKYGDSNHGATIKCLQNGWDYIHLSPFYDNPNFETEGGARTYEYQLTPFITHLKGGFSEHKMSNSLYEEELTKYLNTLDLETNKTKT